MDGLPVLTSAPTDIEVEQPFDVFTPDAATTVAQVNLLRLGAATHAYDENQRIGRHRTQGRRGTRCTSRTVVLCPPG